MLPEEAAWIGTHIESLGAARLSPLLNLGSGSQSFRDHGQPFIGRLWSRFEAAGGKVVHVDLRAEPGVDLVGDFGDPAFQRRLRGLEAGAVLASNLLEHVHDVPATAALLASLVPPGGYLVVTGPLVFPYHPDPIDNGLRLTPTEAAALFPGLTVVAQDVVASPESYEAGRRRIRAMGWRRRLLRRLYWAKETVRARGDKVLWALRGDHDRMPKAYAVVLRKEA